MEWKKKGPVYTPGGKSDWVKSHAQVPTPLIKDPDTLRVYYSARDQKNISRISFVDLNAHNPGEVLYVHDTPVLDPGKAGTFDDCGVMPSWIVKNGEKLYLYYIGWNVRNTVPYYNSVGLAISEDNGTTFKKFSEGPLWDRNYREPYFSASTCVLYDKKKWKCWYLSCTEYRLIQGKYEPRYHIKYAESDDGINWVREGKVAIDYASDNEAGIVKASVVVENGLYKMWYSHRNFLNYRTDPSQSYKIGYAESVNGIDWKRKDDEIFAGEQQSWDAEMQCYPHVIDVGTKRYMFYNGNGFGVNGFGYAEKTR